MASDPVLNALTAARPTTLITSPNMDFSNRQNLPGERGIGQV
jgi:hypothetical protein